MLYSLNRLSTWITGGTVFLFLLELGACLTPLNSARQRRAHRTTPALTTPIPNRQLYAPPEEYADLPPEYEPWYVPPEPIHEDDDDEEMQSNGEKGKVVNGLPYGHGLRRMLGDLQTCAEDLLPYSSNANLEQPVTILGSKLRSCREAIFSMIRWAKALQREIHAPPEGNPNVASKAFDDITLGQISGSKGALFEKRAPPRTARTELEKCETEFCDKCFEGSKPPTEKCKMCFPAYDDALRKHCIEKIRKKTRVLVLEIATVAVLFGIFGLISYIGRKRSQTGGEREPGPDTRRRAYPPWIQRAARILRPTNSVPDVEANPGPESIDIYPQTPLPNQPERAIEVSGSRVHSANVSPTGSVSNFGSMTRRGVSRSRPGTPISWR
ncbi:hypothetical protein FQN52_008803 [Onygenales sp. PD_12]|nr:hypothetical protein FQN52_008803 [Onygenales sp. PD_12]